MVNALGVRAFLRERPSLISVMVFDVILRYCLPMSVQPISAVNVTRPITRHLALSIEDIYGLGREWPFTDALLFAFLKLNILSGVRASGLF